MLTFIVFIIILGLLIFIHELGHFLAARWCGVKVEQFAFGFPPTIYKKQIKGTEYLINAIPLGGYVKMLGEDKKIDNPEAFTSQKNRKKLLIVLAGVIMNILLAYVLFVVGYLIGMTPVAIDPNTLNGEKTEQVLIASVEEGSPAQKAGIEEGDIINNFTVAEDLAEYANEHRGETVKLNITQDGIQKEVSVDLRKNAEQTALGVGLGGQGVHVKLGFGAALVAGAREIIGFTVLLFKFIFNFIVTLFTTGKIAEEAKGVAGPVGIYTFTGQAVKLGFNYIVQWIAILSLNLALINVLPFPALDGGRAVFILLEGTVRRKVVKEEVEGLIHMIGFILLIILVLAVTYREIMFIFTS